MNKKLLLFSILGATAVLTAAVLGLVLWMLGNGDKAAQRASTEFATALVRADPHRAPRGATSYVTGVARHFGKVSAAEVIDTRNAKRTRTRNTGGLISSAKQRKLKPRRTTKNTTTFHVADVLVRTARGPVVLELEFNSPSLTSSSETVSDVRELSPAEIRDGVLDDDVRAEHATAFAARGGVAATSLALTGAFASQGAQESPAMKRLHCLQAAHGDVTKMQACS